MTTTAAPGTRTEPAGPFAAVLGEHRGAETAAEREEAKGKCRLCQLPSYDKLFTQLAAARALPVSKQQGALEDVLARTPYDVAEAVNHMSSHGALQAEPPRVNENQVAMAVGRLRERPLELAILRQVARLETMSAEQVARVFNEGASWEGGVRSSALVIARRRLRRMAYAHLLYRAPLMSGGRGDRRARAVYAVGRIGAAALEVLLHEEASSYSVEPFARKRPEKGQLPKALLPGPGERIRHDLGLNDLLIELMLDARERPLRPHPAGGGRQLRLTVRQSNLWGQVHLAMEYTTPTYWEGDSIHSERNSTKFADGFLALGCEVLSPGGVVEREFVLPLLVENDRASRQLRTTDPDKPGVDEQLWDYVMFAHSRSHPFAGRFPQLAASPVRTSAGVAMAMAPMLMVTSVLDRGGVKRARGIVKAFQAVAERRKLAHEAGLLGLPPMYVVGRQAFEGLVKGSSGAWWDAPVLSLHREGVPERPLLHSLLADTAAFRNRGVPADSIIALDWRGSEVARGRAIKSRKAEEQKALAATRNRGMS